MTASTFWKQANTLNPLSWIYVVPAKVFLDERQEIPGERLLLPWIAGLDITTPGTSAARIVEWKYYADEGSAQFEYWSAIRTVDWQWTAADQSVNVSKPDVFPEPAQREMGTT